MVFAFLEMRLMCESHDRSEEMSIPRYAEDTNSIAIVKSVLSRNFFGPCYVNDLAFRWVEYHVPFMTPAFKVVKISGESLIEKLLRWKDKEQCHLQRVSLWI